MLLGRDYAALTPKLFRAEADAQSYFPFMLLAHVFTAVGITWLSRAGRSSRTWAGQGVRFGLALAFYAVVPTPGELVAKQIVFDSIAAVILGLIAAAVNRDSPAAARAEDPVDEELSPIPR